MFCNLLYTGDCVTHLNGMPEGCVDLAFADPPFNIGYDYDTYQDNRSKADYLDWSRIWMSAVVRVLKPTGSFFVAIGDEYAAELKVILDELGLTMRNWIIWHYTFGVNCKKKFNRSHAHILYYVKDKKSFTFNADSVRVPSARQTTYADKRANPAGKVPDDTWIISRVCGTFKERGEHPCQMPQSLLERIVLAASNRGDLVLDPFAGSGTTLAAAKKHGRDFVGIELSPDYSRAINERLNGVTNG